MTEAPFYIVLPLDDDLFWSALDATCDALQEAGLPRPDLVTQAHNGLADYALGVVFRHQYGQWIEDNLPTDEVFAIRREARLVIEGGVYKAHLTLVNRDTALLLKLTFGGAL